MESSIAGVGAAPTWHGRAAEANGYAATAAPPRVRIVAEHDVRCADLVDRMVRIGKQTMSGAHTGSDFVFTLTGTPGPGRGWRLAQRGISLRYGAIAALGLLRLPEADQRAILGGGTGHDLVGSLASQLDGVTGRGEVALLCWAAAEAQHEVLPRTLARLSDVDRLPGPVEVIAAAWVLSALVAARPYADVEEHLAAARDRLLAARRPSLFPHVLGGVTAWYRSHVGSFADQVYPVQALARLHASGGDPLALATAESVAAVICRAQGKAGQWWWHYDARSGEVIEDYPVYSVHQHAMAPMALFDLAEAGGQPLTEHICRGLRWLDRPAEAREELVVDQPPVIWRKVARREPRKLARGVRAGTTRVRPGMRLPVLDRVLRPGTVDHECRPYELGWLLYAWLAGRHD